MFVDGGPPFLNTGIYVLFSDTLRTPRGEGGRCWGRQFATCTPETPWGSQFRFEKHCCSGEGCREQESWGAAADSLLHFGDVDSTFE